MKNTNPTIKITARQLRALYPDPARAGLTYNGQPITRFEFARGQGVSYYNGDKLTARFQGEAWLDD